MTTTSAVRLEGVTKDFGPAHQRVHAVRGIDLELQPGEIVAFLGPNGAGKTTTIDMVLGLSRPTTGEVSVLGLEPRQAIARGLVSAVMQTGGLIKDLTVRETVEYTASLFADTRPVDEVIANAGITGIADRRVAKCSAGEQQRLRFAMALLSDPALLLLDEPTTGMDVEGRRTFWSAISLMPASASTSSTERVWTKRLPVYSTVSRTLRSLSSPPVCMTAETRPWATAARGAMP